MYSHPLIYIQASYDKMYIQFLYKISLLLCPTTHIVLNFNVRDLEYKAYIYMPM